MNKEDLESFVLENEKEMLDDEKDEESYIKKVQIFNDLREKIAERKITSMKEILEYTETYKKP